MLLYDENRRIEWHNPFVARIVGEEHLIGKELVECFPALKDWDETEQPLDIPLGKRIYLMQANPDERLIYLTDVTEWRHLEQTYRDEQIVFGILHLDNLEDVTQEMDDQSRTLLQTNVTGAITEWGERPRHFTAALRRQVFYDFSSQDVGSAGEIEI